MSSKKRNSIIAILLLVIVGGGFLAKTLLDKRLLTEFTELTAKLPGTFTYAEAKADALAKRLTLTGVKYVHPQTMVQVAVDKLLLEGGDISALSHPGTQRILSLLDAANLVVTIPKTAIGMDLEAAYKTFSLEDVYVDVQAFVAVANGPKPQTKEEEIALLQTLAKPLEELRIGLMKGSGVAYTIPSPQMPVKLTVDSFDSHNVGVFASGKSSKQNVVIDASPMMRFSAASMDMDGLRLPNTFDTLGKPREPGLLDPVFFKPHILQLANFSMKSLSLTSSMADKKTITMDEFTANVDISPPTSMTLATGYKNLTLPPELVELVLPGFMAYHGKPLHWTFDGDMEYQYDPATQVVGMNLRNLLLQEPNLGEFRLVFRGDVFPVPWPFTTYTANTASENVLIHSFVSSFENKGIVELVSKLAAVRVGGAGNAGNVDSTAKLLRDQAVASLLMKSAVATGSWKTLTENLARVLQEHGRFEFVISSKEPINLNRSVLEKNLAAFEAAIQSSFTPAAQ